MLRMHAMLRCDAAAVSYICCMLHICRRCNNMRALAWHHAHMHAMLAMYGSVYIYIPHIYGCDASYIACIACTPSLAVVVRAVSLTQFWMEQVGFLADRGSVRCVRDYS